MVSRKLNSGPANTVAARFHTGWVWKRAATVVAGPLFNFLLTIAVFAVLFSPPMAALSRSPWWPR